MKKKKKKQNKNTVMSDNIKRLYLDHRNYVKIHGHFTYRNEEN